MKRKFRLYVSCSKRFEWGDNVFDPNMFADETMTLGELCGHIEEKLKRIDPKQKIIGVKLVSE
jgi:hypothetical protein